jgi:hypothetical protein
MPAFLARRYAVATDVERRDDVPVAFTWRGRRYVVHDVLDHWWETSAWWMRDPAEDGAAGGVGDDEQERWRVEARAGRSAGSTAIVVELCFAWRRGTWTVDTVMD